jgi:hypothetical protein
LARRCPAYRRREPGLPLLRGTWEGAPRAAAPGGVCGGEKPKRMSRGGPECRGVGALADWPVVVMRRL